MQIAEMIDLMGVLGIGETPSNAIALKYLNQAHLKLYRQTANINPDLLINEQLTSLVNQNTVTVTEIPFIVSKVYQKGQAQPLEGMAFLDFVQYQSDHPNLVCSPRIYAFKRKIISFFPIQANQTYDFSVWYCTQPKTLTELTLEDAIPYPIAFHDVLVDGALYYLFQDESGFKNPQKEKEALARWEAGKSELFAYLYGSAKQQISTFSSV
jgi:hypothetical protein